MKKYRIIQRDAICDDIVMSQKVWDGMDEDQALETLLMFQSNTPDKKYEIEEYYPEANRIGRDPDLH